MSSNTRVTRSKGKSDGSSLPARSRPRRKPTRMENDDGDTILNATFDAVNTTHRCLYIHPHSDANPHHHGLVPSECEKLQYQQCLRHHRG